MGVEVILGGVINFWGFFGQMWVLPLMIYGCPCCNTSSHFLLRTAQPFLQLNSSCWIPSNRSPARSLLPAGKTIMRTHRWVDGKTTKMCSCYRKCSSGVGGFSGIVTGRRRRIRPVWGRYRRRLEFGGNFCRRSQKTDYILLQWDHSRRTRSNPKFKSC